MQVHETEGRVGKSFSKIRCKTDMLNQYALLAAAHRGFWKRKKESYSVCQK
jgi:hypothetical protein